MTEEEPVSDGAQPATERPAQAGRSPEGPEPRRPSAMIGRMVASSRFFVLIATVSLFFAFMAVMVSTMITTVITILHAAPASEPPRGLGRPGVAAG